MLLPVATRLTACRASFPVKEPFLRSFNIFKYALISYHVLLVCLAHCSKHQSHDIDIWRATHDAVDFVSTPASPLLLSDYNVSVIVDDLSAAIQSTFLPLDSLETDIHSRYHSYDALQAIHTMLAADFPNHLFKLDLGPSAQDRPIEALKLSTGLNPSTGRPKPQLLFVAGQHAREWISTSTALFLAHTMVTELADPEIYDPRQELLDAVNAFDFVFLPSINPDGYQYSWEHDRLWRKSRQPTSEPGCVGLDLNRNWDFNFRSPQRPNPCLDTWPGPQPFEAPETRAVRDYVLDATNHVVAFIDLHSFGQMVLIPWSSDCSQVVKDYEDLTEAGLGAAKRAQFLHGKSFEVGQSCEVNYPSSGESTDWSYGAAKCASTPS